MSIPQRSQRGSCQQFSVSAQPHGAVAGASSVVPSRKCPHFLASAVALTANQRDIGCAKEDATIGERGSQKGHRLAYILGHNGVNMVLQEIVSSAYDAGNNWYLHIEEQNSIHTFHSGKKNKFKRIRDLNETLKVLEENIGQMVKI